MDVFLPEEHLLVRNVAGLDAQLADDPVHALVRVEGRDVLAQEVVHLALQVLEASELVVEVAAARGGRGPEAAPAVDLKGNDNEYYKCTTVANYSIVNVMFR